ncbi:hypothetical protein [Phocaeicola vulgatus]|uniref:hypothetical protein n=1 Tax=Phocaeicola vulgatus TaxID=821 RepID=UPI002307F9D9|nr:hypothetical protein [Phocaeicola vulgatus]MDB0880934.1 hypothetical protein [Phocaeicola vulgatus]MDB0890916.1 hypothetical protein [Phocaeicola vulgatus]MDB0895873.1 hypothetical protein [Phocaeicola vulgatus]MDB0908768.1 hypothetical protein [Phocaeicola vulgatus]
MNNINLNELRDRAYKTACEHGFHDKRFSEEHFLCLIILKLMEAVEADRKGILGKKCKSRFEMDYNRYIVLVTEEEEKRFKCSFEKNVKDTLPDKLSDAVIRLLDLCGLRKIDINDFTEEMIYEATESCNGETFTESIYAISTLPIRYFYEYNYSFESQIGHMLLSIIGLAKHMNIDLIWHVEQKMRYNELRPKLNGKRY